MTSLSSQLIEMLKNKNGWVNSVESEDLARTLGFKSSNASRRLRELYNKGLIEREYRLHDGVRIVYYRYKHQEKFYSPKLEQLAMSI